MSKQDVIFEVIQGVLADKGNADAVVTAEATMGDLGLDSLDMATVVASLELELDHDPFAEATPTFANMGEFAKLYEGA